jgi:hypothetical protein
VSDLHTRSLIIFSFTGASNHDADEEKDGEKSSADYQWICKWDMPLRGQVYELEQLCREWVETENNRRQANHTASIDKKKKAIPAEEILSRNAEITKIFTQLSSIAFAPPYNDATVEKGGVVGIRKALTTEKIR